MINSNAIIHLISMLGVESTYTMEEYMQRAYIKVNCNLSHVGKVISYETKHTHTRYTLSI